METNAIKVDKLDIKRGWPSKTSDEPCANNGWNMLTDFMAFSARVVSMI